MDNPFTHLRISYTAEFPDINFRVFIQTLGNTNDLLVASSETITYHRIQFKLKCSFSTINSYILNPSIEFFKINDNPKDLLQFFLIVLDYDLSRSNRIFESKENIIQKVFSENAVCKLDQVNIGPFLELQDFDFLVKIKLVKVYDFSSILCHSFGALSNSPYFVILNLKEVSNASFKLQSQDRAIWVVKQIICKECPFFEKMFQKEWLNNSNDEEEKETYLEMENWSDPVLIAVILHLYLGWLPGTPITNEVYTKLHMDPSELEFDYNLWVELVEIANMLELGVLAVYAAIQAKNSFSMKLKSLFKNLIWKPDP